LFLVFSGNSVFTRSSPISFEIFQNCHTYNSIRIITYILQNSTTLNLPPITSSLFHYKRLPTSFDISAYLYLPCYSGYRLRTLISNIHCFTNSTNYLLNSSPALRWLLTSVEFFGGNATGLSITVSTIIIQRCSIWNIFIPIYITFIAFL
jgi:hypothetical protein